MNKFSKKIKAFTVAEILIVIMIVGIIAIGFINAAKTGITYYLNKFNYYYAFTNLTNGVAELAAAGCTSADNSAGYCAAESGVTPSLAYPAAAPDRGFCYRLADIYNTVGNVQCDSTTVPEISIDAENVANTAYFPTRTPNFKVSNGLSFYNFGTDSTSSNYTVYLDIDGPKRKSVLNTDVMPFIVNTSGTVTPYYLSPGANSTNYLSASVYYTDSNNNTIWVPGATSVSYYEAVCLKDGSYNGTSCTAPTQATACSSNSCSVIINKPGFSMF